MTAYATFLLLQSRGFEVVFFSHGLIEWIIIGLLAGWLTGKVTRGRGFGCLTDIILGLVGAVLGGWLFSRFGFVPLGFWGSLATATVGAVLLVAVARLFAGHD